MKVKSGARMASDFACLPVETKMEKFTEKQVQHQMSDAFINNVFLALSGGFQDAYTYNSRAEVFSNAQTGNVVLMTQHMIAGEWLETVRYIFPLLAFAMGVFVAERVQHRYRHTRKLHWRQTVLLIEILLLFAVGFIPHELDMVATALVSFTCAMQVQAFRKVSGYSYASTMCIGNLRSGMEALSVYLRDRRPEEKRKMKHYFGVILFFAVGAGIGGNLSVRFGIRMIWISCLLLLVSFLLMFKENADEMDMPLRK